MAGGLASVGNLEARTLCAHALSPPALHSLCLPCRPAVPAARPSLPTRKPLLAGSAASRPAGTPKAVTFAAQSAAKVSAIKRLSSGGAVSTPRATVAAAAAAAAEAEADLAGDEDMLPAHDDYDVAGAAADGEAEPMHEDGAAAQQEQQQAAAGVAVAVKQEAQQDTPRGAEAPAVQPGGGSGEAAGKTPWRTPAPVFNEAKTPATAGPASGWQLMYQDEEGESSPAEEGAAADTAGGHPAMPDCHLCRHMSVDIVVLGRWASATACTHVCRSCRACLPACCASTCGTSGPAAAAQGACLPACLPAVSLSLCRRGSSGGRVAG